MNSFDHLDWLQRSEHTNVVKSPISQPIKGATSLTGSQGVINGGEIRCLDKDQRLRMRIKIINIIPGNCCHVRVRASPQLYIKITRPSSTWHNAYYCPNKPCII